MADPDLSEFFKYSHPKRPPCKAGFALKRLKGEARAQLVAALETDQGLITGAAIERWLGERDIEVTAQSVANHRKGKCTCGG